MKHNMHVYFDNVISVNVANLKFLFNKTTRDFTAKNKVEKWEKLL